MRTDRVVCLLQLAIARGLLSFDEIRPGNRKWERKRDTVLAALERQVATEVRRDEVLSRAAAAGLWAGVPSAVGAVSRTCEETLFDHKQKTLPWVQLRSPEEIQAEMLQNKVADVEQFNDALARDPKLVEALDKQTGGMRQRHLEFLQAQRAEAKDGGVAAAALDEAIDRVRQREAEAAERRRRMNK